VAKSGKKYKAAAAKVDRMKYYTVPEAVALVKETSISKFDGTVECHVRLGVDPRQADQQVRGVVVMPNGLGKTVRILVFCQGDGARLAREAGADFVADTDEWIAKIQGGWTDFDVAIATPDVMGKVGRVARILGPRGLMPNPKVGTVTADVATAVKNAKAGQVQYRTDKGGIIHSTIGRASFDVEQLSVNLKALMEALIKAKPATSKGQYVRRVALSSTMGPGVRVDASTI
jgi:large subunit ribosomal protein L1